MSAEQSKAKSRKHIYPLILGLSRLGISAVGKARLFSSAADSKPVRIDDILTLFAAVHVWFHTELLPAVGDRCAPLEADISWLVVLMCL